MNIAVDWHVLSQQWLVIVAHFLWQAAVVGVVIGIALRLSARGSASVRYALSSLGMAALPACVVATLAYVHATSESRVMERSDRTNNNSVTIASSHEQPLGSEQIETSIETESTTNSGPFSMGSPPLVAAGAIATDSAEMRTSSPIDWQERVAYCSPYLLCFYCMGVVVMLSRLAVAGWSSRQLRATMQPITDSVILRVVAEQAERLGLRRVPLVAICRRVSVPVVVDVLKPTILLPPALLCGLDPHHLAAILSHELTHIRRYDLLVNLLQRMVESLLFFHPVTWWISRRMSVERENCCDDLAAACGTRFEYADALLRMAEICVGNDQHRRRALASVSADGGNATDFGYRIGRMIGREERAANWDFSARFVVDCGAVCRRDRFFGRMGQNERSEDRKADRSEHGGEADGFPKMEEELTPSVFSPEPVWQAKLERKEVANEMFRISPVVVAANKVLTSTKNFDIRTGSPSDQPFAPLSDFNPVYRRKSTDRRYIIELGYYTPGNPTEIPSSAMRILRADDGKQVGTIIDVQRLGWSAVEADVERGGNFVMIGDRKSVRVYRIETGTIETTLPVKIKRVDALAFSPDHDWLVVSDQNDLHFWRWRDQAPVKTIYAGRKIDSLMFTPDGQYLAEGPDSRKDIQIRDMRTLKVVASLKDEVESPLMVRSMDITYDGRFLVAQNEVSVDPTKLTIPHRIHVWDLKTREPVFQIATGEWARTVAFSDDGRQIIGEFLGAAHGALLAAWQLPERVRTAPVELPRDAKDRLGDGIQWSLWGDKDGLLSGARLVLPDEGVYPGDPLVIEYRLANVSDTAKTIRQLPNNGPRFPSIGSGKRIHFDLDRAREPKTVRIDPGDVYVDRDHRVSIDTTGLRPGKYTVVVGSAFFYPDETDKSISHGIPHRGTIPFTLLGDATIKLCVLPPSDIHWGQPVAGLQLGARWNADQDGYAIGETVEANLFVANVSDQPIQCAVALPHRADGWLFNVEDHSGSTIMLERPTRISMFSIQQYIPLRLAPGEIAPITGEGLKVSTSRVATDEDTHRSSQPNARFQIVGLKRQADEAWPDYTSPPELVSQGGHYHAVFSVTLFRPNIPKLRLALDSSNVPFSVVRPD